jgi:hypothetical protein
MKKHIRDNNKLMLILRASVRPFVIMFIILGFISCSMVSCKRESVLVFTEKKNYLYFDLYATAVDAKKQSYKIVVQKHESITLNLANENNVNPPETVTVNLCLKLMGDTLRKDKKVIIEQVEEENLTKNEKKAIKGKHFEPLKKEYTFKAQAEGIVYPNDEQKIPIVLKFHKDLVQAKKGEWDDNLGDWGAYKYEIFHENVYRLKLRIVENGDFSPMSKKISEMIIIFYYKDKNPNEW